jgi:hypothetical protein
MTIARLFVPGQPTHQFPAAQVSTLATFHRLPGGRPDFDRPADADEAQVAALMGLPVERIELLYSDGGELVYALSNAADYDDAQANPAADEALAGAGWEPLVGPILIVSEN